MQRLLSRKLLLAVLACVYIIGQAAGGAVAPTDAVDQIAKLIIAYLAAEGIGDAAARLNT